MNFVEKHFSQIASAYRDVRTTDIEPILYISDRSGFAEEIHEGSRVNMNEDFVAADIGCGAGRYDRLLFRHLGERLFLHCVDATAEMLAELDTFLRDEGIEDYRTHVGLADRLPLRNGSLDCMFTFNACHHFDMPGFLAEAQRTLKPGGQLFIYTRTRTQNARSCWGVHFPSFAAKETRLYEVEEVTDAVAQTAGLELVDVREFRYDRTTDLERLVEQARQLHYSTFSLYDPEEFEQALEGFERNLSASYSDLDNISWHDENTMYLIARTR